MSGGFGVPAMNFAPLGRLGQDFEEAGQRRKLLDLSKQLGPKLQGGDYVGGAALAFEAGDAQTGLGLLKLGESHRQTKLGEAASADFLNALSGGGGGSAGAGVERQGAAAMPSFADQGLPSSGYIASLFKRESGGNPNARASTSSATGLGQFTDRTWAGVMRQHPDLGLTADGRTDPQQMLRATQAHTDDNAELLRRSNLPVSDASVYALHIFGSGGGRRFVAGTMADPNRPAASLVGPEQAAANRSIFYHRDGRPRTAGEVFGSFERSFGGGRTASRGTGAPVQFAENEAETQALERQSGMVPAQATDAALPPVRYASLPGNGGMGVEIPSMSSRGSVRAIPPSMSEEAHNLPPPSFGGSDPSRTMTMPGDEPPVQVAQLGGGAPQMSAEAGERAVRSIGTGSEGLSRRVQAYARAIASPYLPEGPRALAKTLLQEELQQARVPDGVKEFLWSRANGMTQARTPAEYAREAKGPQTAAPGTAVLKADGSGVDYMVPDRDKIGAEVDAREAAAVRLGLQPGTPDFTSYTLTGRLPKDDQARPSASDRKAIMQAEDALPEIDSTIDALTRAKELNNTTYTGFSAGWRGLAGTVLPDGAVPDFIADPKTAAATREFGQLMSMEAIKAMSSTLKGATTDREMERFMDILGDPTTPADIRGRTIDRLLTIAQRHKEISRERVNELRGGTYFQPGGGQSAPGRADRRALPAPSGSEGREPQFVTAPPPAAVEALRRDPSLRGQFDAKYGPGSAAGALGGR